MIPVKESDWLMSHVQSGNHVYACQALLSAVKCPRLLHYITDVLSLPTCCVHVNTFNQFTGALHAT